MRARLLLIAVVVWSGLVALATAHPNAGLPHTHGEEMRLVAGFLHPLLGLDHLLAMLAVGLIAVQFSATKKMWLVPGAFVGGLVLGGVLALGGLRMGFVEAGVALSLVALGCGIAVNRQLPIAAVALAATLFGFVHGFAHGAEAPALASPWEYVIGFTLGTILLHLAGLGLGLTMQSQAASKPLQFSGALLAAFGLFLLVSGLA